MCLQKIIFLWCILKTYSIAYVFRELLYFLECFVQVLKYISFLKKISNINKVNITNMNIIKLEDEIVRLDKILKKPMASITFKEIISLVFHAIELLMNDKTDPDHIYWWKIYEEFMDELNQQNKKIWPELVISKSDHYRRINIMLIITPFIRSKNILMLLLRLLYVEKYKRPYINKVHEYYKILNHRLDKNIIVATKLSLAELFEYLQLHLERYQKIYSDERLFEYQIAEAILRHIK